MSGSACEPQMSPTGTSQSGANVASAAPIGESIPATLHQFMEEHNIDPKNFEGMLNPGCVIV